MRCEDARKYLSPYLDSELDPKTSFDISRHLEGCSACRERFEAEKAFETSLVERIARPEPGDDALWAKVMARGPRRKWLLPVAGIAVVVVLAAIMWATRSPEHDLLEALRRDYADLASGRSHLDLQSSQAAAVEHFFQEQMGLAVRPPASDSMKLVGARKCSLRGTPAAFTAYQCRGIWVSVAVFDGAHLDRFPRDRESVDHGLVVSTLDGVTILIKRSGWKTVCVVGELPADELRSLLE